MLFACSDISGYTLTQLVGLIVQRHLSNILLLAILGLEKIRALFTDMKSQFPEYCLYIHVQQVYHIYKPNLLRETGTTTYMKNYI